MSLCSLLVGIVTQHLMRCLKCWSCLNAWTSMPVSPNHCHMCLPTSSLQGLQGYSPVVRVWKQPWSSTTIAETARQNAPPISWVLQGWRHDVGSFTPLCVWGTGTLLKVLEWKSIVDVGGSDVSGKRKVWVPLHLWVYKNTAEKEVGFIFTVYVLLFLPL